MNASTILAPIAIDALDTSAALADASEINPNGWERVALLLPDGKVKEG